MYEFGVYRLKSDDINHDSQYFLYETGMVYDWVHYMKTVLKDKNLIWSLADPELVTYVNNDPTMQFLCILEMVAKNQWTNTNTIRLMLANAGTMVIYQSTMAKFYGDKVWYDLISNDIRYNFPLVIKES